MSTLDEHPNKTFSHSDALYCIDYFYIILHLLLLFDKYSANLVIMLQVSICKYYI